MVPDAVPQELQYTEADIQRLSPRDHIRLRPGMYIGGTDAHALHHLIYEVVDNAIDEAWRAVVMRSKSPFTKATP